MKTDGLPEEAVLAVVIVRHLLIKLSGERWTRVREEDRDHFMKYLKALKSYYIMLYLRMQQLTNRVRLETNPCFWRKMGSSDVL